MKNHITAILLIASAVFVQTLSADNGTVSVPADLHRLETQLQAQLEKIKYAGEVADHSASLARMRIARELRRSEAALVRQIEILERLKEQMQEQIGRSSSSSSVVAESWEKKQQSAIAGLVQQIQSNNLLLKKIESLREMVEGGGEAEPSIETSETTVPSTCPYERRWVVP
ncbi:MAG: hypothetical protein V1792_25865 [Pseudomonadota bacterium]